MNKINVQRIDSVIDKNVKEGMQGSLNTIYKTSEGSTIYF